MAKGDTFTVTAGSEIELTFQLNLKVADLKKRNDADQLTHVIIEFIPDPGAGAPRGDIRFRPLLADVTNPDVFEVLPIPGDDPKFTRLYRVGFPTDLSGIPLDELLVRVGCKLCPKEGLANTPGFLPADSDLCRIRVKKP